MPEYHWITNDIFTVSDFLDPSECEDYVRFSESKGYGDAPVSTSFGQVLMKDIRNNARVMVDDASLAGRIWERAALYVPSTISGHRAIGVNERFRFYRYDLGQTFKWHHDGYFERENGERSRLTLMIYLNDDFEGGHTRFEDAIIRPERGTALFFVHHLLHEGAIVTRGQKYVLRTDVMYSG
jgi:prolyl 4-hydroxylase